jgi:hypothetical protein
MSPSALLPTTCRCGALTGVITDDAVICSGCGASRVNISPPTQQMLDGITRHFGELKDPVVFRRPDVIEQINKQDETLRHKFTRDGKSWFDVITDNLGKADEPSFIDPLIDPESEPEQ